MYWLVCAVTLTVAYAAAQMCQNYGKQCFDHSSCCGGCCTRNVCVDSTRSCTTSGNECEAFYCPAGQSCELYQLPGCPGCAIVPYCRLTHPSQGDNIRRLWFPHNKLFKPRDMIS